jgi:iron complex outermembrane receptor protein
MKPPFISRALCVRGNASCGLASAQTAAPPHRKPAPSLKEVTVTGNPLGQPI